MAFAKHPGVREKVLDAYTVLELDHRVMLFFDRAIYHMARGFAAVPAAGKSKLDTNNRAKD